ncbi:MAG: hypothetical protein KatS3mg028_1538 [Bacteroidia bacterium]|nr:MAG: hypothetical protein KatS3mg028_1538 [Bacteroidia bacterium]GIV33248.1 MAG: hypothetical protein KatS3mg031_0783 [Chitinophagales bacterium]
MIGYRLIIELSTPEKTYQKKSSEKRCASNASNEVILDIQKLIFFQERSCATVTDAIGHVVAAPVAAFSPDRMRMHLSVGGLPKGIYFLRVYSGAGLSGSSLFVKL